MRKALALPLMAALLLSCSRTPEQKLDLLSASAAEQIDRYQFTQARLTIGEIGEIDPGHLLIPYYTGLINERRLCYQDALQDYLLVGAVDPEFGPALAGLCRSYSRLGEFTEAVRAASQYARIDPSDRQAATMLARAMIGLGQYIAAAREIDRTAELGLPDALSGLMTARVMHLRNEVDTARALRARAMAEVEESVEFLINAADLYETVGLIDSAMHFSRRMIETAPKDHDLFLDHFFRCLRVGYFFDARRAIDRVSPEDGGETVRTGMWLHYYRAVGERSRARDAAADYRRLTQGALMSVSLEILARAESSDFLSATSDISGMEAIVLKGDYLPEFKKYMAYWLQINYPEIASSLENMAALQNLSAEYTNALDVKLRIAYLMHKIGDFDGYKEFVSILEEYHRSQPDWLTGIADVNAKTIIRKYDQAERLYTRALELNRWYRPAFEHQVAMYRSIERYADALDLFERYPHFAEQYPTAKLLKAGVLAENDRFDDAQAMLIEGTALASGDLAAVAEYLDIIKRRGEIERVDPVIEMLTADRSNPDRLHLAALWECERQRYQKALDLTEQCLSVEPDNADYQAVKARALHGLGRKSEAFELFEENYARDRNNVLNNMFHSRLLADDGIDLDRASNIAREANANTIADLEVWMNLSYVYFQAGRYDLSRGEANKAANSFPNRPEPFFRIGMAMYMEGKPEARENLLKAVALGLVGRQLEQANETLAKL